MRLDLNLATHPYVNARAFVLKWGALLLGLLALTVALAWLAVGNWRQTRVVARDIEQKRREIAVLQQQQKDAEAKLNLPQNRGVREQAAFLNELIARKSFSWTEVFTELEQLMPTRVRVVSIRPQLDADNQLEINMAVAGDSQEKALELLRRMEDSRHFRQARLRSETLDAQGGIAFQISAVYMPTRLAPAAAAPATGGAP